MSSKQYRFRSSLPSPRHRAAAEAGNPCACRPHRHRVVLQALSTAGVVAFLLAAGPRAWSADPETYAITDLGSLGGENCFPRAINNKGQVVGYSSIGHGIYRAFLYDGTRMRDLGTLGGTNSYAYGINDAGQVVGQAQIPGDRAWHAFLSDGTTMIDLGTAGGSSSSASGINASGQIVGSGSTRGDLQVHALLYDRTGVHDLGTLGGRYSSAIGINDTGQIAGDSCGRWEQHMSFFYDSHRMYPVPDPQGQEMHAYAINAASQVVGQMHVPDGSFHAWLYDSSGLHDLGTLGGHRSLAYGINNAGVVVGFSSRQWTSDTHAFIYKNGVMLDLTSLLPPGFVLTQATGINEAGQIIGVAIGGHAFLLTPMAVAPPRNLAARVLSSTQIGLAWTDTSNRETGFVVQRKRPGGEFAPVGQVAADVTRFVDGGLSPMTTYIYRVQAISGGDASEWSNEAAGRTLADPPAAPTGLTAQAISPTQIDLQWQDNSSNETGFSIWRKTGTGDFQRCGGVPANVTAFRDRGLTPNTAYSYQVRASNGSGASGWSNIAAGITPLPAPTPPSELRLRVAAPTQITFSWKDNSSDETGFEVWRRCWQDGGYRLLVVVPANTILLTDFNLQPNTTYTYRVRAVGTEGISAWSNEITWRTPPAQ